jgi:enamine deaminase RidA (YjgF/YER057c/UK114 family)
MSAAPAETTDSHVVRVDPPELARPSGFAHAVRAEGSVSVHLSGQTALGADGRIVPGDVVVQFEQALTNLLTALRAAGGEPGDLVEATVYLLDIPGYQARGAEIGAVWRRLIGRSYPAMTGVGVTGLWQPEALVEISGTAVLPPR